MKSPNSADCIEEIIVSFLEAEESGEPPDRRQFLSQHPEWQTELESFFANRDRLARALGELAARPETPASRGPMADTSTQAFGPTPRRVQVPPPILADFGELEEIAHGGIGVVYRGRDPKLDRELAVKVLRRDRQEQGGLAERFVEEARIVGRLQHPGVPPVHTLGETPDGRPYFSMKLIRGRTLAQLLADRGEIPEVSEAPARSLPRFIKIFEQACQTMAYAHSQGILHRDLKPSNIMVGAFGEVQVMDWGFAKVVHGESLGVNAERSDAIGPHTEGAGTVAAQSADADKSSLTTYDSPDTSHIAGAATHQTEPGQVMGTLAYMAPEQARGEVAQMDERSDVFGLGAILCEILTGKPPYLGTNQDQVLRMAQEADLSEAWQRLAGCGADCELIDMARRCLSPAAEERPRHAGEVADAVAAYQAGVQARLRAAELTRATAQAKAGEERKRRKLAVALAAVVVALVLSASGTALWYVNHRAALDVQDAQRRVKEVERLAESDRRQARAELGIESALESGRAFGAGLHAKLSEKGGVFDLLNAPAVWHRQIEAARAALNQADVLHRSAEQSIPKDLAQQIQKLREQIAQDDADLALATKLDKVREDVSIWLDGRFNFAFGLRDYPRIFKDAGLELVPGGERDVSERIRQSAVSECLVAALDFWAYLSSIQNQHDQMRQCLAVARLADPDPWRDHVRNPDIWTQPLVLRKLAALDKAAFAKLSPQMLDLVGTLLPDPEKEQWQHKAVLLYPADFRLLMSYGNLLANKKSGQSVGAFRAALAVRRQSSAAWNNLGNALANEKDPAEAINAYNKAIDFYPRMVEAWINLGMVFQSEKELDKAGDAYKKALELNDNKAEAWNYLGTVRYDQKDLDGAIAAFKRATDLDKKYAKAWTNLGTALYAMKDLTGAKAAHENACDADPTYAMAWYNLGVVLADQKDLPGAIAAYQKAKGIDPSDFKVWSNLGLVLRASNDHDGAMNAFKKTIELAPKLPEAWHNLGRAHKDQGEFAKAKNAFQQAKDLIPAGHPLDRTLNTALRMVDNLLILEQRLPAVLQGEAAGAAEKLALSDMCLRYKKHSLAAVRLLESVLTEQPALAANLELGLRYHAARAAALTIQGKARDASDPGEKEKASLGDKARNWLRADFDHYRRTLKSGSAPDKALVVDRLAQILEHDDWTGVRAPGLLAKLPETERSAWKKLWADANALAKEVREAFTDTRHEGILTPGDKSKAHSLEVTAGKQYVLDLESQAFATLLILENASGKKLVQSDDISPENPKSRITFLAKKTAAYRVIVTSFEQRGIGPYILRIREFAGSMGPSQPDRTDDERNRP